MVTTDSRTQGHAVYKTVGDNLPAQPIVVLIDRNTASAAEILTAALADDAGATVVGTRSYGKGVFQQEVDLSNGGALKLTSASTSPPTASTWPARASTRTSRRATIPAPSRDEGARTRPAGPRRQQGGSSRGMSPRGARGGAGRAEERPRRGRGAAARGARPARLPRRARGRGAGAPPSAAEARSAPRRDLTDAADLHRRPGDRARLRRRRLGPARGRRRPALDPHRRRRRPRRPGLAARPRGAPARQQHLRPGHGRADAAARAEQDACSLAPGVERLAVTAEIELGAGGAAGAAQLLPQPDPLRRPPRLRPARRRSSPAARAPPEQVAEPLAVAREAAAALGERRGATSLDVESSEPEFRFDAGGQRGRRPRRRSRPSPTG